MSKAYITSTTIRSSSGNLNETIEAIFSKKTSLKKYSNIVDEKVVCIGKFKEKLPFRQLILDAVDEVLENSNLDDFSDTLLLVGSSVGGMATTEKIFFEDNSFKNVNPKTHNIDVIASTLDDKFNFYSHRSYSTACTSSANALKTAKELIAIDAYKNILVVGADEICLTTIFGFSSLGILSDEVCTPFIEERKGMNVAEGIGVLLLQATATKSCVELSGVGASSDAFHIANPDPESLGAKTSMSNALRDADVTSKDINYINAHGTGTQANDTGEANAILDIFDNKVDVSSSKQTLGHTLGAAGAIEAIVCVEAIKRQQVPPQISSYPKEKDINLTSLARDAEINYVLSNSFAFGGNNTSLVFGVCNDS